MIMHYLKSKLREILIVSSILLLFFITFLSFSLPVTPYLLGTAIVLFTLVIYWGIDFFNYKKDENLKKKLEDAEDEIKRQKNARIEYQNDIESYFLLWVHQMKTPITASKLILDNPDDENIQHLRQEILQIDNYTNLTLSYLKLMNTTTDMTFSHVSVNDLIKPLIKKYSVQFIHNNTRLHFDGIDDMILTDSRWSSIMIEQLLNNALKYAKGKEIWITFDDGEKKLKIRDTGIGIHSADIPKIFDKGYSGFNGRLNDKSSGLGLYIAKSISEKLGHPIEVESELDAGSTFIIHFVQSENHR